MVQPIDPDDEKPLDPAVERVRRKLVRFVAINLGLLFLALMAVVVAIVYRASRIEEPPAAVTAPDLPMPADGALVEGTIALPAGARVLGQSLASGRISLHVMLAEGDQAIFVYDMTERRMIGRFAIAAGQ